MRAFGWITLVAGIVYIIVAFNIDVSVSVNSTYVPGYGDIGGGEVANIDLIARRQNHLIFASLITLIGVLMVLFSYFNAAPASPASAQISTPVPVKFEGERNLANDAYRLWLANTYAIVRNDVFDRFVMGEATFSSLDEALAKADEDEREKLAAIEEAKRQLEEVAEQQRLERLATQAAEDARWQRRKPWVISGGLLVAAALLVGFYFLMKGARERQEKERLALEQAIAEIPQNWKVELPRTIIQDVHNSSEYETYLCNDKSGGNIVEFKPGTSVETVQAALDESLGDRQTEYEFEGDSAWHWGGDGVRADLHVITGDLNLCLTKIGGVKPAAKSAPSPPSHQTEIPAAFRGEWNDDLSACGTGLSDAVLRVSATRLQFYESDAEVKSLTVESSRSVRLSAVSTGEGETWNSKMELILSGSGDDLTIRMDGDGFTRHRCP